MPVALTRAVVILAMVTAACRGEPAGPGAILNPVVASQAVAPGPFNALSGSLTLHLEGADSVAARFGVEGGALNSWTPVTVPGGDSVTVPILGLRPGTSYEVRAVAWGGGVQVEGSALRFQTDTAPTDLPVFTASGSSPSPGYVVLAAYPYGLVIDNTGRVVWYRRLTGGSTLNFQAQPTGFYTTQPTSPDPADTLPWVEYDPLGREVRRLGCVRGLRSRFHDLLELGDRSYWIMCDETRTMDLSSLGGVLGARVTGTVIQHVRADRSLAFEWSPFDHFDITDLDLASRTGPTVNWTHGNALDLDQDGNLVVSFRSLSEVTKISTTTGAVLWRFGGLRNQFVMSSSATPFVHQHGLRLVPPLRLLVLDNLGEPSGSQAEEWVVDVSRHVVTPVGVYAGAPAVTALLGGSTQRLPGGRTLVAYGNGNRVQEYDGAGNVVWELVGDPGYIFRAQRIGSLYAPGMGTPR